MSGTPDDEDALDDVLNTALTDPALDGIRTLMKCALDTEAAQRRSGTYVRRERYQVRGPHPGIAGEGW